MPDQSPVDEWLQIRRKLLERETAFTDLAIRAVSGGVSLDELATERASLERERANCAAAFQRAFPQVNHRIQNREMGLGDRGVPSSD